MVDREHKDKTELLNILKVLGVIFSIMIIYNYSSTVEPEKPLCTDPKFSLMNPYNTSQVTQVTADDYKSLIDLKNFSFLINPQPCKDYEAGLLLLIIISSNPTRYGHREVIRKSWGRSRDSTKVIFLVGQSSDENVEQHIHNESEKYSDIVQGNFQDTYRNMTYKHVMGLKWVIHHCPSAKYVLKTDDDVLVNSIEMRSFLAKELSPWGATDLILCPLASNLNVQRSGKWKVEMEEYKESLYPRYCLGWTILYSQDVVANLLSLAQKSKYFWIDDAFITGILAEKLKIPRTSLQTLVLNQRRVDDLLNKGPRYAGQFLFGPQDRSPDSILKIWKAIPK